MKGLAFSCLILFLVFTLDHAVAQSDRPNLAVGKDTLKAENLIFRTDSGQNKIISAGRISRNIKELPLTVYVITHEEIMLNQYTSLVDVLRSLPGIMVSQPGSGELGESFQIRGLTGNLYTKILINGLPVKPSVVSGMPFGNQLPVRQAERIEVIYGTASAIYGADAVSGVINIITKEADKGTFVRGDIALGEGLYNYINFMIGGKGGRNNNILQYSFYGSKSEYNNMNIQYRDEQVYNPLTYYQNEGIRFSLGGEDYEAMELTEDLLRQNSVDPDDFIDQYYGSNYSGTLTKPDMEALGSASNMIGLQMEFRGLHLSYNNMYRRTHSSLGLTPVYYLYNNPQNFWGENIRQTNLGYSRDFRFMTTKTNISNLVYRMDNNSSLGLTFLENTDRAYRYSASNDLLLEQSFSFVPQKNLELVAGISYQKSGNLPVTNYLGSPFNTGNYKSFGHKVKYSDPLLGAFGINPFTFSNLSEFLQFFYTGTRLNIMGGLRYDKNNLYGNSFSPQVGALYKTSDKTTLRLSFGNAYKAPPSSITYHSVAYPEDSGIHYMIVPNPGLRPEKFNTLELGINTKLFRKLELDQTFYFYQITNHIVPRKQSMSFIYAVNDSVTSWINNTDSYSNIYGSQTNIRYPEIIKSLKMDAEFSLSFLDRKDHLPEVGDIVRQYLTFLPKHEGKLKVSLYPVKSLYLCMESQWMSKWLRLFIPFENLYKDLFRDVDGFYSMNVTSSYSLSTNLRAFVKVINLFDEKYGGMNATIFEENLIYNPQLRRSFRIGFSYNLN